MGTRRSIAAGLLLLLASPALASDAGSARAEGTADAQPVRVYTNADLERLGPVSDAPAPQPDGTGWEFVAEFLEREHRRIDADRAHDLERRRVEAESAALSRRHDRVYIPYVTCFARDRRRAGPRPAPVRRPDIVPLHARPTLAESHRARAIRHSGAGAVPNR